MSEVPCPGPGSGMLKAYLGAKGYLGAGSLGLFVFPLSVSEAYVLIIKIPSCGGLNDC